MRLRRPTIDSVIRYGTAVALAGLAWALTLVFQPVTDQHPSLLFVAAVVFSAWYGGLWPGLLTAALADVALSYIVKNDAPELGLVDVLRLGVLFVVAVSVSWLSAARSRAEEALRQTAARTRAIINTAADGIVTLDETGRIESFNPAAERLFGYAEPEILRRRAGELLAEPYRDNFDAFLGLWREEGGTSPLSPASDREFTGLRKDGTTFSMDLAVSVVQVEDDHRPGGRGGGRERLLFIVIVRDITERKRLEREILEIGDRERGRIGQDLHDGLGQRLTGIAFMAGALKQRLGGKSLPEAADAAKIADLVNDAISRTRSLARGMSPVHVGAHGLMSALEELTSGVQSLFKISSRFVCEHPVLVHDDAAATHLFRIAQEAVNNALKHAAPTEIIVRLSRTDGTATLAIEDDGKGIPGPGNGTPPAAGASHRAGMGLQIMAYRAKIIGGSLQVRRAGPDGGTVVACSFPIAGLVAAPGGTCTDGMEKERGLHAAAQSTAR